MNGEISIVNFSSDLFACYSSCLSYILRCLFVAVFLWCKCFAILYPYSRSPLPTPSPPNIRNFSGHSKSKRFIRKVKCRKVIFVECINPTVGCCTDIRQAWSHSGFTFVIIINFGVQLLYILCLIIYLL